MRKIRILLCLLSLLLLFTSCATPVPGTTQETPDTLRDALSQTGTSFVETKEENSAPSNGASQTPAIPDEVPFPTFQADTLPVYTGSPFVPLNGNTPYFKESDLTATSFESYASLDRYGRCGTALACIGRDLMPTEERGSIGQVRPSGWHTVKYDQVDGKYLYNRCHLIGYQLSGENANTKNLITGTRYLNVEGMLPFENMVADFVKETGKHVLYRVTPVFLGEEMLARGVVMEARSVEDGGDGILFCVFVFNVQPQIAIDYATGESTLAIKPTVPATTSSAAPPAGGSVTSTFVLNTNTKKIHWPTCPSAARIAEKNRQEVSESLDSLLLRGYEKCKNCF